VDKGAVIGNLFVIGNFYLLIKGITKLKIHTKLITNFTKKKKNVCSKNNLCVTFTNNYKVINFSNSGKDKTPVTRQRGVNQIPCECA